MIKSKFQQMYSIGRKMNDRIYLSFIYQQDVDLTLFFSQTMTQTINGQMVGPIYNQIIDQIKVKLAQNE